MYDMCYSFFLSYFFILFLDFFFLSFFLSSILWVCFGFFILLDKDFLKSQEPQLQEKPLSKLSKLTRSVYSKYLHKYYSFFSCPETMIYSPEINILCLSTLIFLLMVRWVIRSILHGGPIEQVLVPASAPQLV